jgi:hypothetical protein
LCEKMGATWWGRDRAINQEINMLRIPARDSGARIRLLLEFLQRERAERC